MISQNRYVNIVSGVGAGAAVAQRKLTLRVITANAALPPGIVVEFGSADDVATYFGSTSNEYARAVRYFGFISKQIVSPDTISFSRFVSASIPAMIVGDTFPKNLTQIKSQSSGTLTFVSDGNIVPTNPIDFSSASTLTDVASLLQADINLLGTTEAIPALEQATVSFNTNTNQFIIEAAASTAGAGTLEVTAGDAATDLSQLLGLATSGTVFVAGQTQDTPLDAVRRSVDISNNFGSFVFNVQPALNDLAAVASWNDAQNNMYMLLASTDLQGVSDFFTQLGSFSGLAVSLRSTNLADDYIDQAPGEILAATNYNRPNSVQNYMYYQFGNRNVTVNDNATADLCDENRINYIGVTQSAGQQLAFYQRGVLFGGSQDAVDMNVYANEMWMKSAITAKLFEMFLNLGRVPANADGAATITAMIQVVIDNAKINGVISVGKTLTEIQKQFITQTSDDETAWRQVETIGYWLKVGFETEVTSDGRTEYYAVYTLIYSKDDAIRKVEGSDILV